MNKGMRKMYTEDEVVALIKKAISDGEIDVGTRLYLHSIETEISGNTAYITIISRRSEAISDETSQSIYISDGEAIVILYESTFSDYLEWDGSSNLDLGGTVYQIDGFTDGVSPL